MAIITVPLHIPDKWIDDDNNLVLIPKTYERAESLVERGNDLLEEFNHSFRLTLSNFSPAFVRKPYTRYVDPAYIAAEHWPEFALTAMPNPTWVKLYIVPIEE